MNPKFIHLRLHSAYSLAEGAIKTEKLVKLCEENNMPAIAVTDTNNLFGAMDLSFQCSDHGIKPIIATQLNVQHPTAHDAETSVLLYAQNKDGYRNLIQLVSASYLESTSQTRPEVSLDTLAKYSGNLILATGGVFGSLGRFLHENNIDEARNYLTFLDQYFNGRLYIELSRHNETSENEIENDAISLAYDMNLPLLATNNVCFAKADDFKAHDALICISQMCTIYEEDRKTSSPEFYFKSQDEMCDLFSDLPEAIANTVILAERCSFMLTKQKPLMPIFKPESGKSQDDELHDMAVAGLEEKLKKFESQEDYPDIRKQYYEQLNYELGIIQKMGFSGYFLIVADYVRWAKSQNIPVGPGRGSGAGSIVAWCVKITEVDPIHFKLFFERFLNPDRVSMPDFDIDFCQERRDEVIAYVQRKYGYDSVAQIITFGKLQARAVVKDIARVMGIGYGIADKIAKLIPFNPTNPLTLQEAIDAEPALQELIKTDAKVNEVITLSLRLEGLYRQAGVHAAGIVISDKILKTIVPMYKDAKSSMPVTQFSMKFIESASLIKFDFLGLKTLTVIQKTLDLINKREDRKGTHLTAQDILFDDKKTFDLLKSLNCVGVFQIESAGMREVLRRMQPDRLEDIIALVALYRPGPMDDIPRYIACKHGEEKITYLHPKLEPILSETYGVMVYQEQVMQIAQVISGYTLGQADILRRAMGKKHKDEMEAQSKRFISGAVEGGVDIHIAEKLFEQMSKFASYGFNKGHSTPYGMLTYQTAYLKANYTIEFFAAIMTLDMNNTDKLFTYYNDARIENHINIAPPDVNISEATFTIDYATNSIIYSLAALKGSGVGVVETIVKERKEHGKYTSIFDFAERLSPYKILNRKIMDCFIKAGVFDSLNPNRHQLYDSMDLILSVKISFEQESLFEKNYPELIKVDEWDRSEKAKYERSAIGFYFSEHPMRQYEDLIEYLHLQHLSDAVSLQKSTVAAVIESARTRTTKNQQKFGVLQVSDISSSMEVLVYADVFDRYADLLVPGNIIAMELTRKKGEDQVRFNATNIRKFDKNFSLNTTTDFSKFSTPQHQQRDVLLQIKINTELELVTLKRLVDNFRTKGLYHIEIIIPNGQKMKLPNTYSLTSYDILDIKNIVGIANVTES